MRLASAKTNKEPRIRLGLHTDRSLPGYPLKVMISDKELQRFGRSLVSRLLGSIPGSLTDSVCDAD